MVHMSETTAAEFSLYYDCHGDSYYDDTDADGLKKSFDKIAPEVIGTKLICCFSLYEFLLLNLS